MNIESVKVLLFDLGNVIIHLDEKSTFRKMAGIMAMGYDELMKIAARESFLEDYEKGLISASAFRRHIRRFSQAKDLSDDLIDNAWNQMLVKLIPEVIEMVKKLQGHYQLMVLSNTNSIHEQAFHKMLKEISTYSHLEEIFDKVYFSHEIHHRKPESEAWQYVLDDNPGLKAEQVLFLDDKIENIRGADTLNIQTKQIHNPDETIRFFTHHRPDIFS